MELNVTSCSVFVLDVLPSCFQEFDITSQKKVYTIYLFYFIGFLLFVMVFFEYFFMEKYRVLHDIFLNILCDYKCLFFKVVRRFAYLVRINFCMSFDFDKNISTIS